MKTLENNKKSFKHSKIGYSISEVVAFGRERFNFLNDIKSNLHLSRKELVDYIINHQSFIYSTRVEAWELALKAKKSLVSNAYEVKGTSIWVCWFDFSMVLYR